MMGLVDEIIMKCSQTRQGFGTWLFENMTSDEEFAQSSLLVPMSVLLP